MSKVKPRKRKRRPEAREDAAALRSAVEATADTVHGVVCDITGSDGAGACVQYAALGAVALRALGFRAGAVGGGFAWLVRPPDGYIIMNPAATPGAFHAWCTVILDDAFYADFSTRTLHAWYCARESMFVGMPWTRPDALPKVVCGRRGTFGSSLDRLSGDFIYAPDPHVTRRWRPEFRGIEARHGSVIQDCVASHSPCPIR